MLVEEDILPTEISQIADCPVRKLFSERKRLLLVIFFSAGNHFFSAGNLFFSAGNLFFLLAIFFSAGNLVAMESRLIY